MNAAKIVPAPDAPKDNKLPLPAPEAIALPVRPQQYVDNLEEQPAGLLANVEQQTETPKQVIDRLLLPGEVVLADFDCYFPYKILPMWKIIMYCIMTGGIYLLILLKRKIERWCYRKKCCTPKILEFVRGKLAVTSKGRIVCWSLEVKQHKKEQSCGGSCLTCCCKLCCSDLCAAPATYEVDNVARTYLVDNIREISHYYRSRGSFGPCLCNEFTAGVKISLNQFDHNTKFQNSAVRSYPATHFMRTMQSIVGAALEMAATSIESALNVTSGNMVYLTTGNMDRMHVDDQQLVFEDLSTLAARFLAVLPRVRDIVVDGNADLSHFKQSEELAGLRVIYDDGQVVIPKKWIPLLPQEKIVAVNGQVFTMTAKEWFLSIVTLGYHYCTHVRERKFLRSALVLTTQRVLVVDIYQRAGIIPNNLIGFTYQVTSYFPGQITSGFVRSQGKHNIEAGLLTSGGELNFSLYNRKRSLPFANALQLSTVRVPVDLSAMPAVMGNSVIEEKNKEYIALLPHERVVETIPGSSEHKAFCYLDKFPQRLVCGSCSQCTSDPVCSKQFCTACFPLVPQMLTCMLRPFLRTSDVVLTDSSVINIIHEGNAGFCGTSLCRKAPMFMFSWVSLTKMQGHVISLKTSGEDTCFRRCCAKCGPCGQCFPISINEMQLAVDVGSFSFGLQSLKQNHNFLHDDKIAELTIKLSNLEAGLHQAAMQR